MKKLIAATAVSLIIASPAYALTTDYDDGAAQFWASLAESSSNANDYVMFSWLADSAELAMTDEKVQAALDVSDEAADIPDAPEITAPELTISQDIESNYDYEITGDNAVPEELAFWGTATKKLQLNDEYVLKFESFDNGLQVSTLTEDGIIWYVDPNEAFESQLEDGSLTSNDRAIIYEDDGEYKLIGIGSDDHNNVWFAHSYGEEFVEGSEYSFAKGKGEAFLSSKEKTYFTWEEEQEVELWIEQAKQSVSSPTITVHQAHTGNTVSVLDAENRVIADTFTSMTGNTLVKIQDLIEEIAVEAYETGYIDGFEDGYEQGYSDGFADGVNSVKDQLQ